MQSFGKNGRFMTTALNKMDHQDLMNFFKSLGVETHIPDGFRIFPVTHSSTTIINALEQELQKLNISTADWIWNKNERSFNALHRFVFRAY